MPMPSSLARLHALLTLLALLVLSAGALAGQSLRYTVDATSAGSHAFGVTLRVDSLAPGDSLFQFAATAPGTYQTMDIGRFVRDFAAVDERGRAVATQKLSTNQWRIAAPRLVRTIRYRVQDTWHAPIPEFRVYPMAGTSLEREHALVNWQAVIGFPITQQASRLSVRILRPRDWQVVTALRAAGDAFEAESFDELVDSPVLMG